MKKLLHILLLVLLFPILGLTLPAPTPSIHFLAIDIYLDSAQIPLAAYQLDLTALANTKIIGLEGGDSAFSAAPYYDPAALANSGPTTNRIILAAYSLNKPAQLPSGKTRIARLHLLVENGGGVTPEFTQKVTVATNADGDSIPTTLTLVPVSGDKK